MNFDNMGVLGEFFENSRVTGEKTADFVVYLSHDYNQNKFMSNGK